MIMKVLNTLNNNAVLVPPNPNELLKATEIFFSKGYLGIRLMLLVSIGLSKFKVAGNIFLFIEIIEKIASTLPAAPSSCPIEDFVELTKISCLNNLDIALSSISSPFTVEFHVRLYNQLYQFEF